MQTSILSNLFTASFTNIDAANTFQLNLSHVDYTDIFVNSRGDALFAFVLPTNAVCCVQMPSTSSRPLIGTSNNQNLPFKLEINQPNLVKRFWSGIKRTNNQEANAQFVSFKFFQLNDSTYLISLCKDFKLKIWCIKVEHLIFVFKSSEVK